MANETYNTINTAIIDLIKADPEFSDISYYYPYTKTLESANLPCCFVSKIERETKADELDETITEDTLIYQVEIYYRAAYGREDVLNQKDLALKNLIKADYTLAGTVADAQCYSSKISSQYLESDLLTVLAARIVVVYES